MKKTRKQFGQGMTEYIIIVALIAIAAIATYSIFGKGIRSQVGNMTKEITGGEAADVSGVGGEAATEAAKKKSLSNYGAGN